MADIRDVGPVTPSWRLRPLAAKQPKRDGREPKPERPDGRDEDHGADREAGHIDEYA
jgi:hypothetical protein